MKWLQKRTAILVSVLAATLLSGCGPDHAGGDDDDTTTGDGGIAAGSLRITPADHAITVNGSAVTVPYKAFLVKPGGSETDVTADATFTIDHPVLGSFSGATFTSSTAAGGRTTVRATARGASGDTSLTVRLETIVLGPNVPANAATLFGGPSTGTAPQLVYPANGVLVPPNLNVMEFHYLPGSGNGLFELTFQGARVQLKAYFTCTVLGTGCQFTPDAATWAVLAMAERGGDPMSYTLRGIPMGAAAGSPVGMSATQKISFGQEDIVGGLYYWNASPGNLKRYEFGRANQQAENFMDAARAGASVCVGCHVLSRDGKKIAVGLDTPTPAAIYKVFDVATRTMVYSKGSMLGGGGANFFSFSPDGSQLLYSNGASTGLADSATGNDINASLIAAGTMPDWSPDGNAIAYAKPSMVVPCIPGLCGAPGVDKASIETMVKSGGTWGPGPTLVSYASGNNNFYPTYSPDNRWVIFNRSPSEANSFDAMDAQVWAISAAGGNPLRLATASTGGDSWPKWAPDAQPYRGNTLMWFTFSSRRDYGLRLQQQTREAAMRTTQPWMAAFRPGRAGTVAASSPAFWLPFQSLAEGNHIAQWAEQVQRQGCTSDRDCVQAERCLPLPSGAVAVYGCVVP